MAETSICSYMCRLLFVIEILVSLRPSNILTFAGPTGRGSDKSTVIKDAKQPEGPGHEMQLSKFQTTFLIEEPYACGRDQFAVIFVHSAPPNVNQRASIRSTWGSIANAPDSGTKLLFLLGLPNSHSNISGYDISKESAMHRDVLQINTIDAYANLTVKSVAMLDWVNNNCKRVQYVIKTDDDTFLNTPLLINDLHGVVHTEFMMGDMIAGARPIRDKQSKYFTTTKEFNDVMYPTYLSGAAYVISGDLIPALSQAAKSTELFWLEDVYTTGILARRVHAKHVYNAKFALRLQSLSRCQMKRTIALHRINSKEMLNAWTLLQTENDKCR